jgi:hypothetical protein
MLFREEQVVEEYLYSRLLFSMISGKSMDMDKLSQPHGLRLSSTILGPWRHKELMIEKPAKLLLAG